MYPFEVPSYVQGHRFSDDANFYDASRQYFYDLAGFDHLGNGLTITAGTPVFETINTNRGLKLDNTFNGSFRSPIPWMGSGVFVIKPTYDGVTTGTLIRYPLVFGDNVTVSSNGVMKLTKSASNRKIEIVTPGGLATATTLRTDDTLVVVAFALDQSTRNVYSTSDGITVTIAAATSSTIHGNALALESGLTGVRFGNLSGTAGDLTAISDFYCDIYEQHFYSENILTGTNLAKTKLLMDALKVKYGI